MDPPDTTAPLFGGNGDLAGAAAAVDLDEIFEDCFAANEWALLNDTLAAEALEPGPPVQGAPGQLPPGARVRIVNDGGHDVGWFRDELDSRAVPRTATKERPTH